MIRPVKICLAQTGGKIGDIRYNLDRALAYIEQAAEEQGNIICLPELFATGYNLDILKDEIIALSRDWCDIITDEMAQAASKNNIYVIAPYGLWENGKIFNGAVLFGPNGDIIGKYFKAHAFEKERNYFSSGNTYPVFDTIFGKIGIMICYDAGFPEVARTLCNKGAEIIFAPSAWRIQDEIPWLLNIPSRALENQLFTVGVNRVGLEGKLHLFGESLIVNPWGKTLYQMDIDAEGLGSYTIDLEEVSFCRKSGGYLTDIKPETYFSI